MININKNKKKKYPDNVYFGITDNENTWGMCCSKEMAYRCAEEHWENTYKKSIIFTIFLITISIVGGLSLGIVSGLIIGLLISSCMYSSLIIGIISLSISLIIGVYCIISAIQSIRKGYSVFDKIFTIMIGSWFILGSILSFLI